jgi:hypothetical protein
MKRVFAKPSFDGSGPTSHDLQFRDLALEKLYSLGRLDLYH